MPAFEDYREQVKKRYETVKLGKDSHYLLNPTTGKLKKLSVNLFDNNLKSNDKIIFQNFFGSIDDNNFRRNIEDFENDKLRPLNNFLLRNTIPQDDLNIELLAIMVDFELRPYENYRRNGGGDIEGGDIEGGGEKPEPPNPTNEGKGTSQSIWGKIKKYVLVLLSWEKLKNLFKKSSLKVTILFCVIAIGVLIKIHFFPYYNCMKWDEDHYVAVLCDSLNSDPTIIARDEGVLLNFRRVYPTQKDRSKLLDKNNKGLIWYARIDGNIYEFFTTKGTGEHPVTKDEIKRVTPYIIREHVLLE